MLCQLIIKIIQNNFCIDGSVPTTELTWKFILDKRQKPYHKSPGKKGKWAKAVRRMEPRNWRLHLLTAVFHTSYREIALQTPYLLMVNGDAYHHISYFFIRPWFESPQIDKKQCEHKLGNMEEGNFDYQHCECRERENCGQCMFLPFGFHKAINAECIENPDYFQDSFGTTPGTAPPR